MRYFSLGVVASLVAVALAVDLPSCATSCVGSSLSSTGCNSIDVTCICNSASWIADLSCCVSKACGAADQDATIAYAQSICRPAGVTNLPTAAGCAATGASSGTAASTAAASSGSSTGSSTGTTTSASSASSAGSASSLSASAASTGAAVANSEKLGFGFGIAAAAGLVAVAL